MLNRIIKILITLFIFSYLSAECFSDESLQIYAVRYGKSMFQKKFVFYGDKSDKTVPLSWMFYYIEYGDKKILVDTGFNNKKTANLFGITDFKDPVSILKDNGISADQVTDIIITHSHFDHIGNTPLFKNARIIISRDELSVLDKDRSQTDVKKFLKGNPDVTIFDDTMVLYDKFTLKKIGGHTRGSSAVFFNHRGNRYCFTGDEVYLIDNIKEKTGNGSVVDHGKNISFINFLLNNNYRLFIFHDNRYADVKDRFIKVFPSE